jgi:hypothetical protein
VSKEFWGRWGVNFSRKALFIVAVFALTSCGIQNDADFKQKRELLNSYSSLLDCRATFRTTLDALQKSFPDMSSERRLELLWGAVVERDKCDFNATKIKL